MYTVHIVCDFYRTTKPNTVTNIIGTGTKQDNHMQIHTPEQIQQSFDVL